MVRITPDQYAALKAAQSQLQQAQANLQQLMALLGLELDKTYQISGSACIEVTEATETLAPA
ncbi:MAG: hypothetical protein ACREXY_04930 [Gammaproteobacteria bacterium]